MSLTQIPESDSAITRMILILSLLTLVCTGWNISVQQIEKPDEPRYAGAAREMYAGDTGWVVPYFNGEPRLRKPALYYWTLAAAAKLATPLGLPLTWIFRAVGVLNALVTALAVFGIGRRVYSARVGFIAAMILITTFYYHRTTRELIIDPQLTCLLSLGWYFFAVIVSKRSEPQPPSSGVLLGLYVSLGLAMLAKGPPLVLIFAVLPMCCFWLWERRNASRTGIAPPAVRLGLWWGIPLTLLIGTSWFLMLRFSGQWEHALEIFRRETMDRIAGNVEHTEGRRVWPIIYYLELLALNFLPWGLFLPLAAWWAVRAGGPRTTGARFLICSLSIPFLIMGFIPAKRTLYLLPVFPFFALWLALAWDTILLKAEADHRLKSAWKLVLALIIFLALVACLSLNFVETFDQQKRFIIERTEQIMAALVTVVMLCAVCWTARDLWQDRLYAGSIKACIVVALLFFGYEAVARPAQERKFDKQAFFDDLRGKIDGASLVWLGTSNTEAVWYLNRPVQDAPPAKMQQRFFGARNTLLVIRKREFDRFELAPAVRVLNRLNYDGDVYLLVAPNGDRTPDLSKWVHGKPSEESEE
jgi:4-amino-4-deoxy-L-arabinose transferase-like glycosyltransferase